MQRGDADEQIAQHPQPVTRATEVVSPVSERERIHRVGDQQGNEARHE